MPLQRATHLLGGTTKARCIAEQFMKGEGYGMNLTWQSAKPCQGVKYATTEEIESIEILQEKVEKEFHKHYRSVIATNKRKRSINDPYADREEIMDCRPKSKQQKLTNMIPTIEQEQFSKDLAMMVFCCNLPFQIVENPHFQLFMKKYLSSYKLPTREDVSNRLLNKAPF